MVLPSPISCPMHLRMFSYKRGYMLFGAHLSSHLISADYAVLFVNIHWIYTFRWIECEEKKSIAKMTFNFRVVKN